MKVVIDPKAEKFIKSQGENALEIWLEGCSSWGVGEPQPSVKVGKPANVDDYDKYEVDGIDAYVRCGVDAKNDELKIKYSKILFKEKLTVEGMMF